MTRVELELSEDLASAVSQAFPGAPLESGVIETLRNVFRPDHPSPAPDHRSVVAIDLILARSPRRPFVTEAQFRAVRNAGRR